MADLKPIGSEKLSVNDKLKRILELTYYQKPSDTVIPGSSADYIRESVNGGVYGIVKEKNEYFVKQGLNENSLDYIGGMFMKNKNRFSSFGDAFKRVDFLCGQETLTEATKYVLKQPKPKAPPTPEPQDEAPMPAAPMPETPAGGDGMGDLPPMPQDDGMGGQDDGMGDSGMDQGGGMGDDERLKLIQKLTGRLGQKLRGYKDKLDSDGIKYILNSILSAVDVEKLDDSAREEIISHFEEDEISDSGMGGQDDGMGGDDMGGGDAEMDETMNTLNNLVNTPLTDENEDFDFDTIDKAYQSQRNHNSDNVVQGEDSIDSEVDEETDFDDSGNDQVNDEEEEYYNSLLNMMKGTSFNDDNMGDDTEIHHNDEIDNENEYFNLEDDPDELPINTSDEESYEGEFSGLEPDYFSQYKGNDEFEDPAIADERHFSKGNFGFSLNEEDPIDNSGEMTLDEITNEINANIKQTLSKYFK